MGLSGPDSSFQNLLKYKLLWNNNSVSNYFFFPGAIAVKAKLKTGIQSQEAYKHPAGVYLQNDSTKIDGSPPCAVS